MSRSALLNQLKQATTSVTKYAELQKAAAVKRRELVAALRADGMTEQAIANEIGLSRSAVAQMAKKR